MTFSRSSFICVCFFFLLYASLSIAAPFEPLFVMKRFTGVAEVKVPNAKSFVPAITGRAYPYGTEIRTGIKSSAIVEFSPGGNECKISENALVQISEDKTEKTKKRIKLDTGKVEIEIEGSDQNGNSIAVDTSCVVAESNGKKFSVEARKEQDIFAAIFIIDKGSLKAYGPNFSIPVIDGDDVLAVNCAYDQSFTRLRNVRGQFTVELVDSDGNPKNEDLAKDEVVKIWRKDTRDGTQTMVSVLVSGADGTTRTSIQTIENKPQPKNADSSAQQSAEKQTSKDTTPDDSAKKETPNVNQMPLSSSEAESKSSQQSQESQKNLNENNDIPEVKPFTSVATFGASDSPIATLPPPPGIPAEPPTPTEVGRR